MDWKTGEQMIDYRQLDAGCPTVCGGLLCDASTTEFAGQCSYFFCQVPHRLRWVTL